MAELKKLVRNCNFSQHMEEALRDRPLFGMRSQGAQQRLLAEPDLTLDKALEIALAIEAAEKNMHQLNNSELTVQQVSAPKPSKSGGSHTAGTLSPRVIRRGQPIQQQLCFRCGNPKHKANKCRHKDMVCHSSHKVGHLAKVCHKSGRVKFESQQYHLYTEKERSSSPEPFFHIGSRGVQPIVVPVTINGKVVDMEINTGAARTVMSSNQHQQLFPGEKLRDFAVVLRTYSTEQLASMGEMTVDVTYGAQQAKLKLLVVEGDGPCLLGRDWLSQIRLDWKGLAQISLNWQGAPSVALQSLLTRYKEVFRPELGTMKNVEGRIISGKKLYTMGYSSCHSRKLPF